MKRPGIVAIVLAVACGRAEPPPPVAAPVDHASALRDRLGLEPVAGALQARTRLPAKADDAVHVEDVASGLAVEFRLEDAAPVAREDRAGVSIFPRAHGGADVLAHVHASGVEDFVAFDAPPAVEELVYIVDVSHVAGLRPAHGTLEFLDVMGAPRLRIREPRVIDAHGQTMPATLAVVGCALDERLGLPWGRVPIAPGASTCAIHVRWKDVAYPLVVDPDWTSTKSMAYARTLHTATLFAKEKVLVSGGCNGPANFGYCGIRLDSAEVYDGVSETFATVASTMSNLRYAHASILLATGDVLVTGGCDTSDYHAPCAAPLDTADLFDAKTQTFSPLAGAEGGASALTMPRSNHAMAILPSGNVLLVGGYTSLKATTDTGEIYNAAQKTFAPLSVTLASTRANMMVSMLPSGRVLVAGGFTQPVSGTDLASAEIFDEATGKLTATGDLVTARDGASVVRLPSGKIFVLGGESAGKTLVSGELFDETANSGVGAFAQTKGSMTLAVGPDAVLLATGRVLVHTGYGAAFLLYDPPTETFIPTESLPAFLTRATYNLLSTGKVLVAGGQPNAISVPVNTAYLYSLAANGAPCSADLDCDSRVCRSGVCCIAECGECQVCGAGTGKCVPFVNGELGTCTGDKICDYAGKCKEKRGRTCTTADECASGVCADGYCCDQSCSDACQICNVPGLEGTCTNVTDTKGERAACASGFVCDGQARTCTPAICNDHIAHPGGQTIDCFPYKCNVLGECVTSCTSAEQCAAPAVCDSTGHCTAATTTGGGGCDESGSPASTWPLLLGAFGVASVLRARRGRRGSG